MKEIRSELINMVRNANKSIVINDEADFDRPLGEIGIDSLDMMSILFSAQEKFGIDVPDEDIDRLTSLNLLLAYIHEKLAKKASES